MPYQGGILITYQVYLCHILVSADIKKNLHNCKPCLIFIDFKEAYGPLAHKCFLTDMIPTQTLHLNRDKIQ